MEFTTVQEACDYAVKKIVEQGKQCKEGNACLYSDGNGNHCAVGWLLPDTTPAYVFNSALYVEALSRYYGLYIPDLIRNNLVEFAKLQHFHDADHRDIRESYRSELHDMGIDVSGEHWQQWVDMVW